MNDDDSRARRANPQNRQVRTGWRWNPQSNRDSTGDAGKGTSEGSKLADQYSAVETIAVDPLEAKLQQNARPRLQKSYFGSDGTTTFGSAESAP